MMDEYLCLTLLADHNETEAAFKARLTRFWSRILRQFPDLYEMVYAEAVEFESESDRIARRYMIKADAAAPLTRELTEEQISFLPVDPDDTYSKAEASSSDWYQIEH
jgi:hypothetical protein